MDRIEALENDLMCCEDQLDKEVGEKETLLKANKEQSEEIKKLRGRLVELEQRHNKMNDEFNQLAEELYSNQSAIPDQIRDKALSIREHSIASGSQRGSTIYDRSQLLGTMRITQDRHSKLSLAGFARGQGMRISA